MTYMYKCLREQIDTLKRLSVRYIEVRPVLYILNHDPITLIITMEALMQNRLDRVETALNSLIDSIASYIPSTTAASDLLEADDELNECVDQCKLLIVN